MKKRFFLSAGLTLLVDLLTKQLSLRLLTGQVIDCSPLLKLSCTRNNGIAFGLFSELPWLGLIAAPVLILTGLVLLPRFQIKPLTQIACGMVFGGFIGNWLERLLFGSVLDMIAFPFLPFFVCNIADIAICFGMVEIAATLLCDRNDWLDKKEDAHLDE